MWPCAAVTSEYSPQPMLSGSVIGSVVDGQRRIAQLCGQQPNEVGFVIPTESADQGGDQDRVALVAHVRPEPAHDVIAGIEDLDGRLELLCVWHLCLLFLDQSRP